MGFFSDLKDLGHITWTYWTGQETYVPKEYHDALNQMNKGMVDRKAIDEKVNELEKQLGKPFTSEQRHDLTLQLIQEQTMDKGRMDQIQAEDARVMKALVDKEAGLHKAAAAVVVAGAAAAPLVVTAGGAILGGGATVAGGTAAVGEVAVAGGTAATTEAVVAGGTTVAGETVATSGAAAASQAVSGTLASRGLAVAGRFGLGMLKFEAEEDIAHNALNMYYGGTPVGNTKLETITNWVKPGTFNSQVNIAQKDYKDAVMAVAGDVLTKEIINAITGRDDGTLTPSDLADSNGMLTPQRAKEIRKKIIEKFSESDADLFFATLKEQNITFDNQPSPAERIIQAANNGSNIPNALSQSGNGGTSEPGIFSKIWSAIVENFSDLFKAVGASLNPVSQTTALAKTGQVAGSSQADSLLVSVSSLPANVRNISNQRK